MAFCWRRHEKRSGSAFFGRPRHPILGHARQTTALLVDWRQARRPRHPILGHARQTTAFFSFKGEVLNPYFSVRGNN